MEQKNPSFSEYNAQQIADNFGTPTYVYDAQKIAEQYEQMKAAFSEVQVKIKYACKALSNINILKLMKSLGSGLDTVSIQEVMLGIHSGFEPDEIIFTPNSIDIKEMKDAVRLGVIINIDSLSMLEQFGNEFGDQYPVCIRLNPHIMAGGHAHISTGHIDSKFGISIYQMPHVHRIVEATGLKINGLHMHTGSDILDADVFLRGAELLFDASEKFNELKFMDFGSGFKVAYRDNEVTTDIKEVGEKISSRFASFCKSYGKDLELWFEPGKYIVSEAGQLLVKCNVVKQTTSTVFVGVNSGQNHLIRPMMYDAYHKIENISNPKGVERIYSVVGYICETDTFGYDRKISEVREGDILAIHNAGAYGFQMSSNYNSRYRPAEVLIHQGKAHLIRRRETFNDLLDTQIVLDVWEGEDHN
ncbi:MAG: diaminopimelate decarboxylase [Bacteroidota bacterium]|nr:diaminopimelate decarboxylase [Bacteroidota bacterium]